MQSRIAAAAAVITLVLGVQLSASETRMSGIHGRIIGNAGEGIQDAVIEIAPAGSKSAGEIFHPDANGYYSIPAAAGAYRLRIRVFGIEVFGSDYLRLWTNDPWQLDFDARYVLATIKSAHSKKMRRFAWQDERTGSHLSGRWMETTSDIGYEPEAFHLVTRTGAALQRRFGQGGAGIYGPGHP